MLDALWHDLDDEAVALCQVAFLILDVFVLQQRQSTLTFWATFQDARRATDQDVVELLPVLFIVMHQEGHAWILDYVAHALHAVPSAALWLMVNGRIDGLTIVS